MTHTRFNAIEGQLKELEKRISNIESQMAKETNLSSDSKIKDRSLLTCVILNSGEVSKSMISYMRVRECRIPDSYSVEKRMGNHDLFNFDIKRKDQIIVQCWCAKGDKPLADGVWRELYEQRNRWDSLFGPISLPKKIEIPWVSVFLNPNAVSDETLEITSIVLREVDFFVYPLVE